MSILCGSTKKSEGIWADNHARQIGPEMRWRYLWCQIYCASIGIVEGPEEERGGRREISAFRCTQYDTQFVLRQLSFVSTLSISALDAFISGVTCA